MKDITDIYYLTKNKQPEMAKHKWEEIVSMNIRRKNNHCHDLDRIR